MNYFIVDTFTDKAFKGNPAAVCILENPISNDLQLNIASEINLAETAFLLSRNGLYNLKWFTPITEVDLCGHATLASAHILWECGLINQNQEAKFETKSGLLSAKKNSDIIEMKFPLEEAYESKCPNEIIDGLGVNPVFTAKNRFDYLIEVESEDIVKEIIPNFEVIKRIDCRGVIVTSKSESVDYDFISRFFAPRFGIPEDQVTGSSHCALGPYWGKKTGKSSLIGYQASRRGGIVKVVVAEKNVILGGKALTVAAGEFTV